MPLLSWWGQVARTLLSVAALSLAVSPGDGEALQ